MKDANVTFEDVVEMVRTERARQDEQWGGYSHDQGHEPNDWIALICEHAGQAAFSHCQDAGNIKAMVRVAAIAFAALESLPRTAEPTP